MSVSVKFFPLRQAAEKDCFVRFVNRHTKTVLNGIQYRLPNAHVV